MCLFGGLGIFISPEENDNSEAFPLPQNLKGVAVKEGKTFLDKKASYFVT